MGFDNRPSKEADEVRPTRSEAKPSEGRRAISEREGPARARRPTKFGRRAARRSRAKAGTRTRAISEREGPARSGQKKAPRAGAGGTGCLRSGYGIRTLGAVALGTCVPFAET